MKPWAIFLLAYGFMVIVTTDIVHVENTNDIDMPVAQYLRMSTEHQRYSTENQQLAIADYTLVHGRQMDDKPS